MMNRDIIDVPMALMLVQDSTWFLDWRGQSAGEGVDGEQIVFNRMPRWTGQPALWLRGEEVAILRARITQAQGRKNAFRFRMLDPVGGHEWGGNIKRDFGDFMQGTYVEYRPQVPLVADADPGDTTILVDETTAERPVQIGQRISIADWPLEVTGRAVEVGGTRLTVAPFVRRAAEAGDMVDLIARGLFVLATDAPALTYGLDRISTPTLNLIEWVTRA